MLARTCFLILLALIVPFSICAQEGSWTILENDEDQFIVAVPAPVNYKRSKFLGRYLGGRGQVFVKGTYFFVFADPKRDADQVKTVDQFISMNQGTTETIRVGSVQGKLFTLRDEDGYHHQILRVATETRNYAFHALSRQKDNVYVSRFIRSARVQTVPFTDAQRNEALSESSFGNDPEATLPATKPPNSKAAAAPTQPQSTASNPVRVPLRLTYKEKAQFPELARFYMIEGEVGLRVFFRSDGTIGEELTVIKGLPFGLIGSAKAAARKLQFTPETLDGKAVTISRPVSYSFNIY